MSSGRRATRPVRQLSLQQPAPRRQHIRRQKSAEDDCNKSLQIYANPIARDRVATNATDKPKVRLLESPAYLIVRTLYLSSLHHLKNYNVLYIIYIYLLFIIIFIIIITYLYLL